MVASVKMWSGTQPAPDQMSLICRAVIAVEDFDELKMSVQGICERKPWLIQYAHLRAVVHMIVPVLLTRCILPMSGQTCI
jgi:hypothetical protein